MNTELSISERVRIAYQKMDLKEVERLEGTPEYITKFKHKDNPLNKRPPYMTESVWAETQEEGFIRGYD